MKILAAISFGLAVAVSGLLLVLPTYSGWSSESPFVQQHATLLQVNGPRALIALAIPVHDRPSSGSPSQMVGAHRCRAASRRLRRYCRLFHRAVLLPERFHDAYGRLAINVYAETVTVHKPSSSLSLTFIE
jgi:hypothetical protein